MDKFRQISTELWPLIVNSFFTLYLWHFFTNIFKLCMKRSRFKMIFFALKLSRGGVCCMPAVILFIKNKIVNIILIHQFKHLFWVLKTTVSLRHTFEYPQYMFWLLNLITYSYLGVAVPALFCIFMFVSAELPLPRCCLRITAQI